MVPVTFARQARERLEAAGFDIDYRESGAAHHVDPGDIRRITGWLDRLLEKD